MKLLLDGSLNQSLQLKDLLSGIFQAEAPGLSVLKFVSGKQEIGELYFLGGHYIVSARLNNNVGNSRSAFEELLQVKQADFVYYACESADADVLPQQDDNLKIELKGLIDNWQEIKPVSEDQLLDKIFNVQAAPIAASKVSEPDFAGVAHSEIAAVGADAISPGSRVDSIDPYGNPLDPAQLEKETNITPTPRDDVDWDLLEPLVSSGAPGSGTDSARYHPDVSVPSAQDVRSMGEGFPWQRQLRKLFLFTVMLLGISVLLECCVWLLINAPFLRLGTRRYAIPMERHNLHRQP